MPTMISQVPTPGGLDELSERIRNKSCILFGGSGLSASAGLPTRQEVIKQILTTFSEEEHDARELSALSNADLEAMFQLALSEHPDEVSASVAALVTTTGLPSPLHNSLAKLDFSGIITSNWDRLLETVFPAAALLDPDHATEVQSLTLKNSLFLLKIAGSATFPDKIIVSLPDLERSLATNTALISALDISFQTNSLFFVGCDWDEIEVFFRGIRYFNPAVRHFAVLPRLGPTWQARARRFQEIYQLTCIPFSDEEELLAILSVLSNTRGDEATLSSHSAGVMSLAVVSGDRVLSASEDSTIRLWDLSTRLPILILSGHTDAINSVALSPNGALAVSGSSDGTVRVWNLDGGELLQRIDGHGSKIRAVVFYGDPLCVASGGDNGVVKLWNATSGEQLSALRGSKEGPGGAEQTIWTIAVSGSRLYAGGDRGISVWDIDAPNAPLLFLREHTKEVLCLAVSSDGKTLVSGSADKRIIIWNLETNAAVRTITLSDQAQSVVISPDCVRVVSGSSSGKLQTWDINTGQLIQSIDAHREAILSLAIAGNGKTVISGSEDTTLKVWKLSEKSLPLIRARFENIGPFEDLEIEFVSNWTILLGNNGVGKSTILRAIALVFAGKDAGNAPAENLIGQRSGEGLITVQTSNDVYKVKIRRTVDGGVDVEWPSIRALEREKILILGFPPMRSGTKTNSSTISIEDIKVPTADDLLPLVNGSVDIRLDRLKEWIMGLRLRSKKEMAKGSAPYAAADELFSKLAGLLKGSPLELSEQTGSNGNVMVRTLDGVLQIEQISQGMTSLISWVGILWQRLYEVYGSHSEDRVAVVLMDEIDAHMHPLWQQLLVNELVKLFPNVQFVATTHSPLIVAGRSRNEIVVCTREHGSATPTVERLRIDFGGLRADQILTSAAFGLSGARDYETVRKQDRYRALVVGLDLGPDELTELDALRRDSELLNLPVEESLDTEAEKRAAQERLRKQWLERPLTESYTATGGVTRQNSLTEESES